MIDPFGEQEYESDLDAPVEETVDLKGFDKGSFFGRITFTWRPEDASILSRIEAHSQEKFAELFGSAIEEIDRFYEYLRVPRQRDGVTVLDAYGRVVWELDAAGKPEEDWGQLTGQDIEQTLMNLQRIKMPLALELKKLRNQALYGKMVADDAKDDIWESQKQGTQGDRQARANRESRIDRYQAFFRYCVWSHADAFFKELNDFIWRLRDIRGWRIQSQ